jgi:sialate O-acetylesterase
VGKSKLGKRSGRVYAIPAGVLRKGKNVISIRVKNQMSNGGLVKNGRDGVYFIRGGEKMVLSDRWKVKFTEVHLENSKIGRNDYPAILFNGMIGPLTRYAIKGVIWYQGESNAGRPKQYRRLFSGMIVDWRKAWGYDFPFLFVSGE